MRVLQGRPQDGVTGRRAVGGVDLKAREGAAGHVMVRHARLNNPPQEAASSRIRPRPCGHEEDGEAYENGCGADHDGDDEEW